MLTPAIITDQVIVAGVNIQVTMNEKFPICGVSLLACKSLHETIITANKSGVKGKQYFLDLSGELCTTEEVVQKYLLDSGYNVIRTEVAFWQAMFAFTFWEEIFCIDKYGLSDFEKHLFEPNIPQGGVDIPRDLFCGAGFYARRKQEIDGKYRFLLKNGVCSFIHNKIKAYREYNYWTRLVSDLERKRHHLFGSDIYEFLERIPTREFLCVVFFIARDINNNRAGLPDFVAWNRKEILHIEAKKIHEKTRDSQYKWHVFLQANDIKVKIIRVEGI